MKGILQRALGVVNVLLSAIVASSCSTASQGIDRSLLAKGNVGLVYVRFVVLYFQRRADRDRRG